MKKIILVLICGIVVCSLHSKDLFSENTLDDDSTFGSVVINDTNLEFVRITDKEIDTFSVEHLLPETGLSLICFSENWCPPSYKEFNRLYNDGIIDFLKENDTRLIILSERYPFLNVGQLDSLARNNIEADFEIYYYKKYISGSFPDLWVLDPNQSVIYHSLGVKEDYSQIKEKINEYMEKR